MLRLKSKFGRNVLTLASGTALSQGVTVLISPILTRLYSPFEYGPFAVYLALVSILSVLATFRYDYVTMYAESDKDAWRSLWLISSISLIASVVFLPSLFLFRHIIERWMGEKLSFGILVYACISIFLTGIYQGFFFWCNRKESYRRISESDILRSICAAIVSIVLGVIHWGTTGLIFGSIAGQIVGTSLLMIQTYRSREKVRSPKINELVRLAKSYKECTIYLLPAGFCERVSAQTHIILLSLFFGSSVTGAIGLHQKVVSLPVQIFGNSVGNVFKQRVSQDLRKNGNCLSLLYKATSRLFLMALAPFLSLLFAAPVLFSLVFGAEWRIAGEYSQILSWVFLAAFVVSPISPLIVIGGFQRFHFLMQLVMIPLTATSIIVGYYANDVKTALKLFAVVYFLKYLVQLGVCIKVAKGSRPLSQA
ncbi:MAG: hypothetical protein COV44_07060 [Deltaproteobacteria bacterium CG11_big_fil_rev_8_21_14_0_20_45_16]|nr:MAG: hypothetical protein COV44_07060 [Deltaproteobacteria bacterium CG11_big_fil_rev_8_21_14_0_20_45_16]